jgi:hypothetical protein
MLRSPGKGDLRIMSTISEAFDALSLEERIALLIALEFEDPARYAEWEEKDTRYYCMFYEVQSELNACYRRSGWDAGAGVVYRAAHQAAPARATAARKTPVVMTEERKKIMEGIKDFHLTISRG